MPTAATSSVVKDTIKRSESQELLANEERAKLLISRLNQENFTAMSPERYQSTLEASSPESILKNAQASQTDPKSKQ